MDYLRSCYSTMMVLGRDGHQSVVDWYFADTNAPRLGVQHRMHSLNYIRPSVPLGSIGEVTSSERQWRNGTRPSYIGPSTPSYSTAGTPDWWLNGTPPPYSTIQVNYRGQKGFPYSERRGIFPTFKVWAAGQSMVSSTRGAATLGLTTPFQTIWDWPGSPHLEVDWIQPGNQLYGCAGNPWTIIAYMVPGTVDATLLCTSWDQATGVSTWVDPSATILAAGEVLTMTVP